MGFGAVLDVAEAGEAVDVTDDDDDGVVAAAAPGCLAAASLSLGLMTLENKRPLASASALLAPEAVGVDKVALVVVAAAPGGGGGRARLGATTGGRGRLTSGSASRYVPGKKPWRPSSVCTITQPSSHCSTTVTMAPSMSVISPSASASNGSMTMKRVIVAAI